MAGHDIEVEVFDGSKHLGTRNRPVRSTPYGTYGVMFNDKVYPLLNLADYPHHSLLVAGRPLVWGIDATSEDNYFPEVCPLTEREEFEEYEAPLVADDNQLLDVDWYLEQTDTDCHFLMDGTSEEVETAVDLFSENNLDVLNYGRSFRAASNDRTYDWSIQLSASDRRSPNEQHLRSAIQLAFSPQDPITNLLGELAELRIRLTTNGTKIFYRGEIANLNERIQQFVNDNHLAVLNVLQSSGLMEVATAESDRSSYNASQQPLFMDELVAELRGEGFSPEQVEDLRVIILESVGSGGSDLHAGFNLQGMRALALMVGRLKTEMSNLVSTKNDLETRVSVSGSRITELESQIADSRISDSASGDQLSADLIEKVKSLEVDLARAMVDSEMAVNSLAISNKKGEDLEHENQRLSAKVSRLLKQFESVGETAELVENILFTATPRITYHLNSIDLLSKFSDPSTALKMIIGLDARTVAGGKKVGGVPGWREHHVSMGDSDDGRLYYKTIDDRVHVLLGRKQTQKRDIRRLSRI